MSAYSYTAWLMEELHESGLRSTLKVSLFYPQNFAVPAPTSVALSSSIPNPISPFGSDVILTCAVELSPVLVDVPVIVNTVLTTPARFTRTSTAQLVMGSNTSYASTFLISSFGRSDSGIYVCAATISSTSNNPYISGSSTANHSVRVTTGE